MTKYAFLKAITRFDEGVSFVIEFNNSRRLMVTQQKFMLILDEYVEYCEEDDNITNFFEIASITRIMGWASLPDINIDEEWIPEE